MSPPIIDHGINRAAVTCDQCSAEIPPGKAARAHITVPQRGINARAFISAWICGEECLDVWSTTVYLERMGAPDRPMTDEIVIVDYADKVLPP